VKLSDYVADFLARQGIRHVFAISGGASLHLIHSIADHPDVDFVCPQHEQAGAMAADAYARVTKGLGAAIATSGPGATNMITGICCAFYDSVPVLYITGQVATFRFKSKTGVRQMGFQETETVSMCKPITKYAVLVEDPSRIRYELEKATWIATHGRPGPVLVDIPDDLQRMQIDPSALEPFVPPSELDSLATDLGVALERCVELIRAAKRPVLILGWGVRLAHAEEEAGRVIEALGAPVVPSWAMLDFLPFAHPLLVGPFGTHGSRYGNFTVQNADLILSVGCRLDTHEIGSPFNDFARAARKIVVDVDPAETGKFPHYGLTLDLPIVSDAKDFLAGLGVRLKGIALQDFGPWKRRIAEWKQRYPTVRAEYYRSETLNPYVFVKALSDAARPDDTVFVDTGCAVAWMSQAFEFKPGQRYFHAFNNTPMGYALPGAIGASIALGGKPVICVTGDGALQMNIQELATVLRHNLPIKIFLLNNHGYSMIQQTQDQWLGSRYLASSVEGGLAFPDFVALAQAYGFRTVNLGSNLDAQREIPRILADPSAVFCNVELRPEERVIPQVKYGRPIEDPEPLLDREEFFQNMIVEPTPASRAPN
jgi:acetolactate synthase-1/2/3 large subunit